MPLILIEGIDGTGKTTLAKQLNSAKDWPIVNIFDTEDYDFLRSLGLTVETYHEDVYFMDFWFCLDCPDCILDRGIFSGFVYEEKEIRKAARATMYWIKRMEKVKNNVFIIHLDASPEIAVKRDKIWKKRLNDLKSHRRLFNSSLKDASNYSNYLKINTDLKNTDEVYKEVSEWLESYNL